MNRQELNEKITKIIDSCQNIDQWRGAQRLIYQATDVNRFDYWQMIFILGIKYGLLISDNNKTIKYE